MLRIGSVGKKNKKISKQSTGKAKYSHSSSVPTTIAPAIVYVDYTVRSTNI